VVSAGTDEDSNMPITRILVPIDFSADSLNALKYASDLAKRIGAELRLLHVVEPTYFGADPYVTSPDVAMLLEEQFRLASAEVARIAANLGKKGQRVGAAAKIGFPAQVIVGTAKRSKINLIIMGTHGRMGLAHALIGSVAERVVRTAHCPVLTIRHAAGKQPKAVKR
jgi:nucleotide-binding universal stress UspA family protein